MDMLDRIKRRLSRTKSVAEPQISNHQLARGLSLSASDEELIAKLHKLENPKPSEGPPPAHDLTLADLNAKRNVFNDGNSGILSLPNEILILIQTYLRPSTEVALRHTCSRFFYLYSMPSFYLAGDEKFDFVCMTERDQDPTQLDRLVCGTCRDIHPATTFPSQQIKMPPLERDCRQVWLCAHKMMGYHKSVRTMKAGIEAPFRAEYLEPCRRCREVVRNRSIADRPEKGTSETDIESPKASSLLISKLAIMQKPAPSYGRMVGSGSGLYKEVFGVQEVSAALQAVDFRICPHITLGDPIILSKFCRSCTNTQRLPLGVRGPPCISQWNKEEDNLLAISKCKGSCFDRQCKTKFMFQARESLQPDASGRLQVWLFIVIYRWLGPLLTNGSETYWRAHTVNHEMKVQMRKSWECWEKTAKNVKPNWDICLLHPEDCNLR